MIDIIKDYDSQPAFADFLPGIAGENGIPAWCFFVNRGQGVASFGTQDKDHPIMEFQPAHTAWQDVQTKGFRTFLKYHGHVSELFVNARDKQMLLGANSLTLQCRETDAPVRAQVQYFILPNACVGALARTLTIENTGNGVLDLEVLDGLPAIVPHGIGDWHLKCMTQTARAWMETVGGETGVPRYRVRASLEDSARVEPITGFAFGFSCVEEGKRLPVLWDPEAVFGQDTSFAHPHGFARMDLPELISAHQRCQNLFPCFFSGARLRLNPGEKKTVYTLLGHGKTGSGCGKLLEEAVSPEWFARKLAEAETMVDTLCAPIACDTADPRFDEYCKRTYLDNFLRGGKPVRLAGHTFHLYSRKHGDLERDYNYFSLTQEPLSQGNGNFRDVWQNRRCDVSFAPFVGGKNVADFYSLIQPDGYNPLVIKPDLVQSASGETMTPGQYVLRYGRQEGMARIAQGTVKADADFGEGYWTDHWSYGLDLIEDFLRIWPEREQELMQMELPWYRPQAQILPREKRYSVSGGELRQYHFLEETPGEKWCRDGAENLVKATLLEKLVCMCAMKFAALDAWGCGIEMEGGRPGWYDALNGLPALFGSSVTDAMELLRHLRFLKVSLLRYSGKVSLPEPHYMLLMRLKQSVEDIPEYTGNTVLVDFWNSSKSALEHCREEVYTQGAWDYADCQAEQLAEMLDAWANFLGQRLALCRGENGLMPTYCRYRVKMEQGTPSFEKCDMPLFLESSVRDMRLCESKQKRKELFEAVHRSELFDGKLGMYRVNQTLDISELELGRAAAFTPGWLENGSIWLHMEYKYLLELLRGGLYEQFSETMRQAAIPFLDPAVYGRSTLENSSFLVSSVNPEEALHGRGYVARLSGSTAEFMSIWQIMMFGRKPFLRTESGVQINLQPCIPAYLIDEERTIRAAFMENSTVIYHFAECRDYFPGSYSIRIRSMVDVDAIRQGAATETVADIF